MKRQRKWWRKKQEQHAETACCRLAQDGLKRFCAYFFMRGMKITLTYTITSNIIRTRWDVILCADTEMMVCRI